MGAQEFRDVLEANGYGVSNEPGTVRNFSPYNHLDLQAGAVEIRRDPDKVYRVLEFAVQESPEEVEEILDLVASEAQANQSSSSILWTTRDRVPKDMKVISLRDWLQQRGYSWKH